MNYFTTSGLAPTGGLYNDGNRPYGSPAITFTSGGTATYDTQGFTPEEKSNDHEQTNRFGVPNAAFGLPATVTGNCEVIIPTQGSQLPQPGWFFTTENSGTTTYIVNSVSLPFKKDDFLVVAIGYRQKLN